MRASQRQVEEFLSVNSEAVSQYASRYSGRGAELEDLEQEGYLAILSHLRGYSKREMRLMIENSLKGIIRDRAAKQRRRENTVRLSQCGDDDSDEALLKEEHITDAAAADDFILFELTDMLERALRPDDMLIAGMLMEGWTQAEIARRFRVSQQSVSKRIARMRTVLRGYELN
ncbi:MAG: sigma-70 family RNA polymerase sigma factor [Synergistaceae bacterium]|jgi:RNA polymerase sigma factor (sigma-70 family)|nr:sigma-70 family RNA polymerase sigma factor [Synergistaceae bacterium]